MFYRTKDNELMNIDHIVTVRVFAANDRQYAQVLMSMGNPISLGKDDCERLLAALEIVSQLPKPKGLGLVPGPKRAETIG